MKTVFIYSLNCPVTGEVRYVGKATCPKKRFRGHLTTAYKESNHRACWIRSIASQGLKPVLEILDEVSEAEWPQWEVAYIEFFRECGCRLVNSTVGGEDPPSCEGRTGEKHPLFGKTGPMFGKQHSLAAKEKIKLARSKQILTEERNTKISLTGLGKKRSNNKSGFVGVSWHKAASKWAAEIKIFSRKTYLGLFSDLEDAVFVRSLAEDRVRDSLV